MMADKTNADMGIGRFAPYVNTTVTGVMLAILSWVLWSNAVSDQAMAERQDHRIGVMVDLAARQAHLEREIFSEQSRRQWEAIGANQKTLIDMSRSLERQEGLGHEQIKLLNVLADEMKKKNSSKN